MRFWNGVIMYAPRTPDFYAIPGAEHCLFRLLQKHGDVQAWNLYWLTKPSVDLIPTRPDNWYEYYRPFTVDETRAFYEALDTVVVTHLTLARILVLPPREAIRLLQQAKLERCRFYDYADGELWRQNMLGRLFLAARLADAGATLQQETDPSVIVDFTLQRARRRLGLPGQTRRPA